MRKTTEKLAEEFSTYAMERHGFVEGYNQKSAEIKDLIEKLELTKMKHSQSSGVNVKAVNNYNAEQDRKINLLKILL